jgi:hypothetical protein
VFGVPKVPLRDVWRIWEEAPPVFVGEISRVGSRTDDRVRKLALYRDVLRVPEYLIYDDDLHELLFYRLLAGEYVLQAPDEDGRLFSPTLGVRFALDAYLGVRVYGPDGEPLPWTEELFREHDAVLERTAFMERVNARLQEEARDADRRAAEQERKSADQERRAQELAAENERLRAELARLRRERGGSGDHEG